MRLTSIQNWRQRVQLSVLVGILMVCLVADAEAARRGRAGGRMRGRRSCPSCNAGGTIAVPAKKETRSSVAPDEPPPPPPDESTSPADPVTSPSDVPRSTDWRPLFDGQTLTGWQSTPFGGEGDVYAEDGKLILEMGNSLTGVNYTGEIPRTNYEVELEAMRVQGSDFFCGFTFPVKDSHASLIAGGWGGGVVGISSIDGLDASENETTSYQAFETGKWYKLRVRVTDKTIEAWIDDKNVVYQNIEGRKINTRIEVDRSQPFGFATYETTGALKNIRLRELTSEELAANP